MEKYPKLFVKVSIFYLLFGVVFGLLMAVNVFSGMNYTFVHVHFNLVGFISMMIFGIAYHVLPRFNAKPLKWPNLVPVHFYGANIGLIGMLFSYLAGGFWSSDWKTILFHTFSTVTAVSIILFIANIYTVLTPAGAAQQGIAVPPPPLPEREEKPREIITPDMKVSSVFKKWPNLLQVFIDSGFKALANPAARATFARMITIKQACKVHSVDLESFVQKLNDALNGKGVKSFKSPAVKVSPFQPPPPSSPKTAAAINRGDKCSKDVLVGDLLDVYPETKGIFEKHYGAGCFSCPGQATETVGQTAMMHSVSPDLILKEINDEIDKALAGAKA
jgi:cytochrome c oxidase cbb3-type subunit 1